MNKYKIDDKNINRDILERVFDFYRGDEEDEEDRDEDRGEFYYLSDYVNDALVWRSPYSLQRFLLLVQDGIQHGGYVRTHTPRTGRIYDRFDIPILKGFYSQILEIADEVLEGR